MQISQSETAETGGPEKTGVRVGDRVRVRHQRWVVTGIRANEDCSTLTLSGTGTGQPWLRTADPDTFRPGRAADRPPKFSNRSRDQLAASLPAANRGRRTGGHSSHRSHRAHGPDASSARTGPGGRPWTRHADPPRRRRRIGEDRSGRTNRRGVEIARGRITSARADPCWPQRAMDRRVRQSLRPSPDALRHGDYCAPPSIAASRSESMVRRTAHRHVGRLHQTARSLLCRSRLSVGRGGRGRGASRGHRNGPSRSSPRAVQQCALRCAPHGDATQR